MSAPLRFDSQGQPVEPTAAAPAREPTVSARVSAWGVLLSDPRLSPFVPSRMPGPHSGIAEDPRSDSVRRRAGAIRKGMQPSQTPKDDPNARLRHDSMKGTLAIAAGERLDPEVAERLKLAKEALYGSR